MFGGTVYTNTFQRPDKYFLCFLICPYSKFQPSRQAPPFMAKHPRFMADHPMLAQLFNNML